MHNWQRLRLFLTKSLKIQLRATFPLMYTCNTMIGGSLLLEKTMRNQNRFCLTMQREQNHMSKTEIQNIPTGTNVANSTCLIKWCVNNGYYPGTHRGF